MTYFYHNSCVVSFEFQSVLKYVMSSFLFRKLHQKIAQCCDVLQILCILWRFGGNIESLVSVES